MTQLLTAAQMRAIEQAAIDSGAVSGLELMERAGTGVVEAVLAKWPEFAQGPQRAVVLCGPGNNGGDGFVIARLLKERGWEVEVYLFGDAEKLPPHARKNCDRWRSLGAVKPIPAEIDTWDAQLIVDALFGTGLVRPVGGKLRDWLYSLEKGLHGEQVVCAVDAPSGICMDSGRALAGETSEPIVLAADLTVTFGAAKIGHFLGQAADFSEALAVNDIGLTLSLRLKTLREFHGVAGLRDLARHMVTETWTVASELEKQPRAGSHKYAHGHALVMSGATGRTGAARLAARGALRIGAGLVTLGVPGAAQLEVASQVTAAMLRRVNDARGLAAVLQDKRFNALCLGPGLGTERARELVPVALRAEHAPRVVLDADALTAFCDAPEALFGMLHDGCVLTPHDGEFARLFPDISRKLNAPAAQGPAYSKVDATRAAAARAGCLVLYKGPDTVIAAPDGRCKINVALYDRAAPWLATAGSGDVLAGFICGLMARGFRPMHAAETAAWLHVECARAFGPGLIAEDLPEMVPQVLRRLEAQDRSSHPTR